MPATTEMLSDVCDGIGMDEISPKFHQLQKLNHMHLNLVELVIDGLTPDDIAKATGRSVVGVRNILATPLFQQAVSERREKRNQRNDSASLQLKTQAMEILEKSQVKAAEIQVGLLECPDPRVQQTAVSQIFDILGWRDKKTDTQGMVQVTLGAGAMLNLQVALNQSNAERTKIVSSALVEGDATLQMTIE